MYTIPMKNTDEYLDTRGRVDVQKIVLSTIAIAGIISIAVLAPNALQIINLFQKKNPRHRHTHYIDSVIKRLNDKGLITFEEVKGNKVARLTEKGKMTYAGYLYKKQALEKKVWDKKWRIVMFDIKEKKRSVRDKVRTELENIGFVKLQNSVWVYPYPCESVVAMLKADAHIGKDVLYIKAERIENDKWLRQQFGLK